MRPDLERLLRQSPGPGRGLPPDLARLLPGPSAVPEPQPEPRPLERLRRWYAQHPAATSRRRGPRVRRTGDPLRPAAEHPEAPRGPMVAPGPLDRPTTTTRRTTWS